MSAALLRRRDRVDAVAARFVKCFDRIDAETQRRFVQRARTLLTTLGRSTPSADSEVVRLVVSVATQANQRELWLILAVLMAEMPTSSTVTDAYRATRLEGALGVMTEALESAALYDVDVEVVTNQVVVDVHHTVSTSLATGIQRVVRQTVRRWLRDHSPLLVAWSDMYRALLPLTSKEIERFIHTESLPDTAIPSERAEGPAHVVVPWRCTMLLPELAAEAMRADRWKALARFSASLTGVIGFDCVPLMAAETSADGMAAGFASFLAAAAHFDRLAAISDAAALEFLGWRSMLEGSGRVGPTIRPIPLTVEPEDPSATSLEAARDLLVVEGLPVILAVGSHEPRKNHLALLSAAETLWQEGLQFTLTFVGGNAWKSESFTSQVRRLQRADRPVQAILAMSDELLWAAYRVAFCTVFVSLHEGFGLPVAESLASGTPVITSNFGSMLEIGERGGALLVDPSEDAAIADALRRMLKDSTLRDRLSERARSLSWRTWDEYAAESWTFLTHEGTGPQEGLGTRSVGPTLADA